MTVAAPTTVCTNCERTDCPLLATVIVGTANYVRAFVDCQREARRRFHERCGA